MSGNKGGQYVLIDGVRMLKSEADKLPESKKTKSTESKHQEVTDDSAATVQEKNTTG